VFIAQIFFIDLYIVAIDFPGHGLSSPRPAGAYYHYINMLADVKYVVEGECHN